MRDRLAGPRPITLIVWFQGQEAPVSLLRALGELEMTGQVEAVDVDEAAGRVFVLGEGDTIRELVHLAGVVAVTAEDQVPTDGLDRRTVDPLPSSPPNLFPPDSLPAVALRIEVQAAAPPLLDAAPSVDQGGRAARERPPVVPALLPEGPDGALWPLAPPSSASDGAITGVVTADDGGAPLENVSVSAYQRSPYVHRAASTDASGVYSISLPGGTYEVWFSPNDHYVPEYYDDVPLNDLQNLNSVAVADGAVTSGIDASLAPGAQISGRVTVEATGDLLPGIGVAVDGGPGEAYYAGGYTGADGVYTTTPGLPAGSYDVAFHDYGGTYATEYYDGEYRSDLATPVAMTTEDRTGIDASLIPGATIDGVVTGSGPLEGIRVSAYYADVNRFADRATTDVTGTYRLPGLGPIAYKVRFWDGDGNYLTEWHQDEPTWEAADPVPLTSGVTTTVNAELSAAGVIRGTVTAAGDGVPLEDIGVTVYDAASGSFVTSDSTDATGVYRIGSLVAGNYKLRFQDYGGDYLSEYYDDEPDQESADLITVAAGVTTTVDAALTPGAVVRGTITAQGSGVPLEDITVTLYDAPSGDYVTSVSSDATGVYRIGSRAAGSYKLYFYDNDGLYLSEYYNDQPDQDSANPVHLTAGVTTTVDAALTPAGVVKGQVVAEDGGAPLDGIRTNVYEADTDRYLTSDTTNAAGVYRVGSLPSGTYKLRFYDYEGTYLAEYYDDQPTLDSADRVDVTAGVTTTVDAALTRAAFISGRVTSEEGGAPLEAISTSVYEASTGDYVAGDATDAAGIYRVGGLTAGAYKLRFYDSDGWYLTEYHDDRPDLESADSVAVTAGMTTSVDAALTPAAIIRGTVTAEGSGAPLEDVRVNVYDALSDDYVKSDTTDGSGAYRVGALGTGSYKVRFYDNNGLYLTEYHNDKPSRESADPVSVSTGDVAIVDAQLTPAATISGRVTEEGSGAPLEDIYVRAYDAATHSNVGSDYSDASGIYRIGRLFPGNYKLRFYDYDGLYLTEYYDERTDLEGADPIAVTSGVTVTIDEALVQGGRITGRVTDAASGAGIGGVSVRAQRQDGEGPDGRATTAADGTYATTALYTGVYRVRFSPPQPYYAEYYDNHGDYRAFTPVPVYVSSTTADVDAVLRAGHVISGRVTGAGGGPLEDVRVYAYRGGGSSAELSRYTDADGRYQLGPLDADRYRVFFEPPDDHVSVWYQQAPAHPDADVIDLTTDATDVDAQLRRGAVISGTVTGSGGSPVEDAWVYVYPVDGNDRLASGQTDAEGRYVTEPGLLAGAYQIQVSAPPGYLSEWYDDQASQAEATVVPVASGVDHVAVDAVLSGYAGGTITGTVTAADTGRPLSMWVYAYDAAGARVRSDYASGGEYVLDHLPPGSYRIRFSASSPYVQVYYGGHFELSDADPVVVMAGVTVPDVDQAVPRGGVITGAVTAAGGVPGVYVHARRVTGGYDTGATYTGVDGTYRVERLEGGDYRISFSPPAPFIGQWYRDAASQDDAEAVSVALNATTPDVDAVLASGGVIVGTITAEDTGAPLPGAEANVYSGTHALIDDVGADMDGVYRTPGLPAGDYYVRFDQGNWHAYISEWYGDAPSREVSLPVGVPASGTTSGVDAALARGGAISGWTYDSETGRPLSGVYARVVESATGYYVDSDYSNGFGFYLVDGLPSGTYHVSFFEEGYSKQWYDRASGRSSALPVTISPPNEVTDIDAHLLPPRTVYLPLVLRGH
jgi:hypothetical protein